MTIGIIDGKFEASEGTSFPAGVCHVLVVIGNTFGSPLPAITNSQDFAGFNGAKYDADITTSGGEFKINFTANDLKVRAGEEAMPTEAL